MQKEVVEEISGVVELQLSTEKFLILYEGQQKITLTELTNAIVAKRPSYSTRTFFK